MSLDLADVIEKVILLVVGAFLTGLLIPIVKARLDEASAVRKQASEAALARQRELIDAQIRLLADIADQGWEFLFSGFKVSYAHAWEDAQTQRRAASAYSPASWEALARLRATISKAARLVSDAGLEQLQATYRWCLEFDDELAAKLGKGATKSEWEAFHKRWFPAAAQEMDRTVRALARELRLTTQPGPSPAAAPSANP